jgi:hypothetical protein
MHNLAIIIVSWNVRDLLAACLRSLLADLDRAGLTSQVWVVDNASSDGTPEMVAGQFPAVRLVASGENLGFARANNLALRAVLDSPEGAPPYVWLLNPDTEVLPGATAALVAALEASPRAGVAGAKLVYGDGSLQQSAFHFPGLVQLVFELFPVPARLYETSLNGRYPRRSYEGEAPFAVDHPLGAAMMVRTAAMRQVGLLDEGYWMYCEEIDWCWRMRRAGWRALCVPAARVIHHAGRSSDQVRIPSFIYLWTSRARFYTRYHGPLARRLAGVLVRSGMRRRMRGAAPEMVAACGEVLEAWGDPKGLRPLGSKTLRVSGGRIAAIVLTLNEERNIVDCLASLAWADRRVVVDSFSADRTVELARQAGAEVIQHPFENYAQQHNAAMQRVEADWVLFVDADERVTPELAAEIQAVVAAGGEEVLWWMPRHNYIFGRLTRRAGWYPDYQARLLRQGRARWERPVHEIAVADGPEGYLRCPLVHYNYDDLPDFVARQERYTTFDAGILYEQGVRPRPYTPYTQAARQFWWRWITLQGWREGLHGLRLSLLMGYYEAVKYRKLQIAYRLSLIANR